MKIKSIKRVGNEDVFNITVSGTHNYITEAGPVLKNCDALRYFCITRTRANREITKLSERELREEKEYDVYTSPDVYDIYKKGKDDEYEYTDNSSGYNPMYL